MCPHGYHHNGFMATPALGTHGTAYISYLLFRNIIHSIDVAGTFAMHPLSISVKSNDALQPPVIINIMHLHILTV